MDFTFVFLWTDILIYLLLFAVIVFAVYSMRFEHLRVPWRQVAHNRMTMAAGFILSCYLLIGICDSVHFRLRASDEAGKPLTDNLGVPLYKHEVLSILDLFVLSIKKNTENSYSAPLSAYSFNKENIILPDGKQKRAYSRLQYGGSHLTDLDRRISDIGGKVFSGGVFFALCAAAFLVLFRSAKRRITGNYRRRDISLLLFIIAVIFCAGAAYNLSAYYHLFGTDKIGLDVFYRALKGVRTGIVIGTLTTLIMLPFAVMMGVMAGYFKGWTDDLIQYVYTTLSSIPGVLLIASAILILQVYMDTHADQFESMAVRSDMRLLVLCAILGVSSWTGLCRILRGETLKLQELEYVQASIALGSPHFRIIFRHIIPNIMHIVLITVVLDFSGLVLAEAVLSYVGVGVDPSMESWGNMINAARLELARDPVVWWNLVAAFTLMFGLVLSANLFADGVRDAFDPRLRTR